MAHMAMGGQRAEAFERLFQIDADIHMPHLIAVPGIRAPLPKVDQAGSSGWLGTILWGELAALGAGGNLSSGCAIAADTARFNDGLAHLETSGRRFSF